jgi:hypothetical protein
LVLRYCAVSTTSYEGFNIVYLDANAMGVPTIALRAAGATEAVARHFFR